MTPIEWSFQGLGVFETQEHRLVAGKAKLR
jgi:hypothetical protein